MTALLATCVVLYTLCFNIAIYVANERSVAAVCIKFKYSTFFTTNRSKHVHPRARPATFFAWELHDPDHLWQSFAPRGHIALLAFRVFALLVFMFVLLFQGLASSKLASGLVWHTWIPYFTNWSFMGFGLYALLGVAVSAVGFRSHKRSGWQSGPADLAARPFNCLDKAFAMVLTTMSSSTVFLSVFYWAVLYDHRAVRLEDAFKHGGSVGFFGVEYLLSRAPVSGPGWFHWPLLYSTAYGVYMWLNWAVNHWWTYKPLDWRTRASLPYYLVLPFLGMAGFAAMYMVAGLREYMAGGKCCCSCCCCFGSMCNDHTPTGLPPDFEAWQDDDEDELAAVQLATLSRSDATAVLQDDRALLDAC